MNDVSILTNNGVNVQSSLELLGDMEMYNETLSDFLDMVEEKKANLEKFKAENDMPNYAIAIHALKSDARYLGFLELGDLAYDSELKAKAGDQAGVEANHANIMSHVDSMVNIANQYLGRAEAPAQTAGDSNTDMSSVTQSAAPQMQQAVTMPQSTPVMAPQANPMVGPQPMPGQMPGYASPMGAPVAQNVQNQIYDLSTGQMVADPNPQPMPAQQPMPNQMPGYGQQMGGYPNQMYNPYQQSMQGYQMPMYGQGLQPMPNQMPGYDPMSQALYQQQQAMQQYQQSIPNPALMPKAGTILVVDDSNLVANFVKKIFESRYDVVIANDGAKAIELCDNAEFRQKIKACLLDLNMPNVDGFQVLEDFKQKGYIVRMPIVVISGAEDAASRDRANTYAIMGILSKPFNERDVQKAVEQCLAVYF